MRFAEGILVLRAQVHHRLHVYLVKRGQHGRFVFDPDQALRNLAAQHGHFLTSHLACTAPLGCGRTVKSCRQSSEYILFQNATVPSCALNLAGFQAALGEHFLGSWRRMAGRVGGFRGWSRSWGRRRSWCWCWCWFRFWSRCGFLGRRFSRCVNQATHRAHFDGVPLLCLERDDSGRFGGKFKGGLVRIHLRNGLVFLHVIAIGHKPGGDFHFADGLSRTRDFHFKLGHDSSCIEWTLACN